MPGQRTESYMDAKAAIYDSLIMCAVRANAELYQHMSGQRTESYMDAKAAIYDSPIMCAVRSNAEL